jgi:hypothetical protein
LLPPLLFYQPPHALALRFPLLSELDELAAHLLEQDAVNSMVALALALLARPLELNLP